MNSTNVLLAECNEGDILANDVYNDVGIKLVSRETVINYYIKERLNECGVEYVRIYAAPSDPNKNRSGKFINMVDYYKRSALCIKNLVNELASGTPLDYDKVIYISELIFRYVDEDEAILKLIDEIREEDGETYSHSINTAFYCMLLAKWLHLSQKDIKKAVLSGFLHDIGKSKIPLNILNKKEPLTNEEFQKIKKHPIFGYYILDENNYVDLDVKRAVLLHHERVNSTGYPFTISSDSLGVYAKIVSIADVYDAMTSNRVYKNSVNPFAAFEMFLTDGLCLFDPTLMSEFVNHMSTYFIGSKIILNTGENGRIVYIPPGEVLSPIIMINNEYINLGKRRELKIVRTLC